MTAAERKKIRQANAAKARAAKAAKKAAEEVIAANPPVPDEFDKAVATPWQVVCNECWVEFIVNGFVVFTMPRLPVPNEKE